ncbi:MAG: Spx/MgsR family RNA polymerase-binding regulatory protein [Pseudobdellovibrio sp.]
MSIKVYEYSACDTCKRAIKFLNTNGILFQKFAIVEQPPTAAELKQMLNFMIASGGSIKNLFNTSGVQYRELNIAEKFKSGLSDADALHLLSINGKLIKRPFLLTKNNGTVGFKQNVWEQLLKVN